MNSSVEAFTWLTSSVTVCNIIIIINSFNLFVRLLQIVVFLKEWVFAIMALMWYRVVAAVLHGKNTISFTWYVHTACMSTLWCARHRKCQKNYWVHSESRQCQNGSAGPFFTLTLKFISCTAAQSFCTINIMAIRKRDSFLWAKGMLIFTFNQCLQHSVVQKMMIVILGLIIFVVSKTDPT